VRSRELQDQPRNPRATADVEDRGRGFRGHGEEHERLHHEVAYSLPVITVGREAADTLPPVQFIEIHRHLRGERVGERESKRSGGVPKDAPEV
jgi:hypothetical protein